VRGAIGDLAPMVGVRAACEAFDFPRASFYRRVLGFFLRQPRPCGMCLGRWFRRKETRCWRVSMRRDFKNSAPAAIYATLLEEGRYH
jgi:putative transposase